MITVEQAIDNEFGRQWVRAQFEARRGVYLALPYIDINDGNLIDGLVFSQIMYWHGPNQETGESRLRRQKDGHYWITKNHKDWFTETRVKNETVRRSLERLTERSLIFYELHGEVGLKTPWLRVNWPEFERRIKIWMEFVGIEVVEKDYQTIINIFKIDGFQPTPLVSDTDPLVPNTPPSVFDTTPLVLNTESNTENTTKSTSENTTDLKDAVGPQAGAPAAKNKPKRKQQNHFSGSTSVGEDAKPPKYSSLEQYLLKALGRNKLTDNMRDQLDRDVPVPDQFGDRHMHPSPNDLFDSDPIFKDFATKKASTMIANGAGASQVIDMLGNYTHPHGWFAYEDLYKRPEQPTSLPEVPFVPEPVPEGAVSSIVFKKAPVILETSDAH